MKRIYQIGEKLRDLQAVAYNYHINGEVLGMKVDEFEDLMDSAADFIERLATGFELMRCCTQAEADLNEDTKE